MYGDLVSKARVQRRSGSRTAGSATEARAALPARLRERLPEIQAAVATRVYPISDPHEVSDPAYLWGWRTEAVVSRGSSPDRFLIRALGWARLSGFPF
jgi:hypothetical protein